MIVAIVVIIVILWLIGVVARIGGSIVHLLLVGAIILWILNWLSNRSK